MAFNRYLGNNAGQAERAQVETLTLGGTWEATDKLLITMTAEDGSSTDTLTVVAGSTVIATIITTVVAAIQAAADKTNSNFKGLFEGIVPAAASGTTITCTGRDGVPFYMSVTTVETDDSPADDQTFSDSTTTTCLSTKDWNNTNNWLTGAVPTTGDTVELDGAAQDDIRYGLNQSGVTLAALVVYDSFIREVGQHVKVKGVAVEHFALKISATRCDLFEGANDGFSHAGSKMLLLHFGTVQNTTNVKGTANASAWTGRPPVQLAGTHASNRCAVSGNFAAVGWGTATPNQSFTLTHLENTARQGKVTLGTGGTITNVMTDGEAACTYVNSAVTGTLSGSNFGLRAGRGRTVIGGSGTVARLHLFPGSHVNLNNARGGTAATTLIVEGGHLDTTQDPRAFTIDTVQSFNAKAGSIKQVPGQITVTTGSLPQSDSGFAGGYGGAQY